MPRGSTCRPRPAGRLRRLEEAGIIAGYEARLSPAFFGPRTVVFVQAELESQRAGDFRRFEAAVAEMPEVVECWSVKGGFDSILKVMTADIESYQALMDRLLEAETGLKRYFSFLVTKPIKQVQPPLLLEEGLSVFLRK